MSAKKVAEFDGATTNGDCELIPTGELVIVDVRGQAAETQPVGDR
jgi:hypothetical protein